MYMFVDNNLNTRILEILFDYISPLIEFFTSCHVEEAQNFGDTIK